MNAQTIKGKWSIQLGLFKQQYAKWTNNIKLQEEGKSEELLGRLQLKLKKSKAELLKILKVSIKSN